MLDEIIMPGAIRPHMGNQTAHDMKLMKTRKQQHFLILVIAHELLQNVHHAVFPEHILPEIGGRIAVRIGGIALAAVTASTVAALIERQEKRILPGELRRHAGFELVNTEIGKNAAVEAETQLSRIPVKHPLPLGVFDVLPGVLVFQLEGEHGDAVHGDDHIYGFLAVRRVVPLPVDSDLVGGVVVECGLVEGGFRLKIADTERNAPVLEAISQDGQQPVHFHGILKRICELLRSAAL